MKIAVVALGKIGLPLAVQYAKKGHNVVGVDINEDTVQSVNRGIAPFPGEAHLSEWLKDVVRSGSLVATTDYAKAIPEADAVVVVVPLVVDLQGKPEYSLLDEATRTLATHLTPRTLVSYETTLPVGTTRNRWKPMIEEYSHLREGHDFHLVFSPERVLSGRIFMDLRRYPKLIGAIGNEGAERAAEFYESVLDFDERPELPKPNGVWNLGSAEAAEFAKLAETTYRDVNIGLVNEFAQFAEKIHVDIYPIIEACNSQPYAHLHRPGISVGGHCIPVYPQLYLSTDPGATIVKAARNANKNMPLHVVQRIEELMGGLKECRVVVFGAAYRGGVKETAFSGVFDLVDELNKRNAIVGVHDPLYSDEEIKELGFTPFHFGEGVDVGIIHTDHDDYCSLSPVDCPGIKLLFDGRRVTNGELWKGVPRILLGSSSLNAAGGVYRQ